MLDTAVYDIESQSMLFRAPGTSKVKGRSTPINLSEELRIDSITGFNKAADEMIKNLDAQLTKFKEDIKNNPGKATIVHQEGYSGSGAISILESLLLMLLLMAKFGIGQRKYNWRWKI